MQFETWARSRETKRYEQINIFHDEQEKFYRIDCVDQTLYSEAMILRTEWQKEPAAIMFVEFPKDLELVKGKKR